MDDELYLGLHRVTVCFLLSGNLVILFWCVCVCARVCMCVYAFATDLGNCSSRSRCQRLAAVPAWVESQCLGAASSLGGYSIGLHRLLVVMVADITVLSRSYTSTCSVVLLIYLSPSTFFFTCSASIPALLCGLYSFQSFYFQLLLSIRCTRLLCLVGLVVSRCRFVKWAKISLSLVWRLSCSRSLSRTRTERWQCCEVCLVLFWVNGHFGVFCKMHTKYSWISCNFGKATC